MLTSSSGHSSFRINSVPSDRSGQVRGPSAILVPELSIDERSHEHSHQEHVVSIDTTASHLRHRYQFHQLVPTRCAEPAAGSSRARSDGLCAQIVGATPMRRFPKGMAARDFVSQAPDPKFKSASCEPHALSFLLPSPLSAVLVAMRTFREPTTLETTLPCW